VTHITLRYVEEESRNEDVPAVMNSCMRAATDHEDMLRSKELINLAHRACPVGLEIDEVGDFDERTGVLLVYTRKS
jgi:hypothetical protein